MRLFALRLAASLVLCCFLPSLAALAQRPVKAASEFDELLAKPSEPNPQIPHLEVGPGKHSFDLRGDTKTVYEQLGLLFGVKVAFDPELIARSVRLRLEGVDFYTAVTALGLESGTFWRPLDTKTIFVTANTAEKRRQFAMQAEQTFPLPASVGPEEMTELVRIIRDMTGANHIGLDTASRTITMRDTPENVALTGKLIGQIERARGEVMLDFDLLEVNRDQAQQLGITPPTSGRAFFLNPYDLERVQQARDLTNALTILAQIFGPQGLSTNTPITLVGGGYTTFLLTLPGVAADFSKALNLVKSGRQVLLRAQDGKPANFFVGDRFPVALSLLSGGANLGAPINQLPVTLNFPQTSFRVGQNPVALTAGNFSGGALPDLAVANKDDSTISILLNQGGGQFVSQSQSPLTLPRGQSGPTAMASGILGNTATSSSGVTITPLDLVIANSASNNVTVLLGNGDGSFQAAPGSPYKVGGNPSSIVLADFNGDGNLDFAVANRADSNISVFKGDGKGGFTEFSNSPFLLPRTERGPVALTAGDFRNRTLKNSANNVPEMDLAVVNLETNNVSILLPALDSQGNLTFFEAPNSPISVGHSPVAITSGDLNRDAVLDLAVVNQGDNSISILLGNSNADGSFSPAPGSPLRTAASPAGIAVANFTGSILSLAVTNQVQRTLGVYLGQGNGTFASPLEIALSGSPQGIVSAIFTNSGLADVAVTAVGTAANTGLVILVRNSPDLATAAVSTSAVPYPAAQYVDLGVKVKATPTIHPNREVTLQLEFEIRALAGISINGIPVLTNRTLSQTVRLKEDETSLIGGLLNDEETRAISGLPGLARAPGAGYALGSKSSSSKDTEFVILITPHRLRSPSRSGASIYAGVGEPPAGLPPAVSPVSPPPPGMLRPEPPRPNPPPPGRPQPPAPQPPEGP